MVDAKNIGKYQVVKSLGRGEFGQVFLAKHPTLPLYRAVKLFNAAGQGEDFLREARLQAGLEHERIVKIVDVGLHLERPYLVMEYAAGGGLDALLADGPLEPARAAALARDVALALEQAHAASVVHRDLKPGNIMLDKEGRAKVADFGLARLLVRNSSHQTRLAGTPNYMAPEQLKGEASPACDMWALGAVLFEMLSGSPPFQRESEFQTMQAIATEEAPDPAHAAPGCPPELAALVRALLSKDPATRPDAPRAALELAAPARETAAPRQGNVSGTVAAGDWNSPGGGPARNNAQDPLLTGGLTRAWNFAAASAILAQPAVCRGRVFAACLEGGLDCLDLLSGERLWHKDLAGPLFLPPLAMGTAVVAVNAGGRVWALNAADGSEIWAVDLGHALDSAPELRPGGLYLSPRGQGLWRLGLAGGSQESQWPLPGSLESAPLFAGSLLIWLQASGKLAARDMEADQEKWSLELGEPCEAGACYAQGLVFAVTRKGSLRCVDALNGQQRWQKELGFPICATPAVDQERLIATGLDGSVACLSPQDGGLLWQQDLKAPLSAPPALGGARIILADRAARLHLLDAATGRSLQALELSAPVQAAPLIWREMVLTADLKGNLTAFTSGPSGNQSIL